MILWFTDNINILLHKILFLYDEHMQYMTLNSKLILYIKICQYFSSTDLLTEYISFCFFVFAKSKSKVANGSSVMTSPRFGSGIFCTNHFNIATFHKGVKTAWNKYKNVLWFHFDTQNRNSKGSRNILQLKNNKMCA